MSPAKQFDILIDGRNTRYQTSDDEVHANHCNADTVIEEKPRKAIIPLLAPGSRHPAQPEFLPGKLQDLAWLELNRGFPSKSIFVFQPPSKIPAKPQLFTA